MATRHFSSITGRMTARLPIRETGAAAGRVVITFIVLLWKPETSQSVKESFTMGKFPSISSSHSHSYSHS